VPHRPQFLQLLQLSLVPFTPIAVQRLPAVRTAASAERTSDTSQHFRGARTEIKSRAAYTALNLLRLHLLREG
jgi:hypothetical protein